VPVELVNDKSRAVNGELLPILNQLYNNRVKMTDNMGGAMLRYMFDRVITKEDMTAVKNYLEGLGYKTQDQRTYELTMSKPGYWLVMTFSTRMDRVIITGARKRALVASLASQKSSALNQRR